MAYKILIFDLDDTLIDNTENTRTAFEMMLVACGQSYTESEFERWYDIDKKFWVDWQDGLIEIPERFRHETGKKSDDFLNWVRSQRVLAYFDNSISQEYAIELNHIYVNALNENVVAIDGAQDTLKHLSDKYTILVATNGPQVAMRQKLEKIDCWQYATEVLSADMFGHIKPNIEFFEAIEKRYQYHNRADYLIIGDSLKYDIGFGMNAGIDSCWLNTHNEELDDKHKPTIIINKLSELMRVL